MIHVLTELGPSTELGIYSTVDSTSDCRSRGCKFEPQLYHSTFVEIDCEIISVILPLPVVQEWQLLTVVFDVI